MRVIAGVVLCAVTAAGASPAPSTRRLVVEAVARAFETEYVFPETGRAAATRLRRRLAAGAYASGDAAAFAKVVTKDLQETANDGHLVLEYSADRLDAQTGADEAFNAQEADRYYGAHLNFGIERVARLEGNIGLLDLRVFAPVAMGGDAVAAAMQVLAATDALIVDLRENGGGDSELIKLIAAYLFDEKPRPLSGYYDRPRRETTQAYTQAYVPGRRFGPGKPVFVLISRKTFSAAEAFAYDLQALRRATIVGEKSGGGAHPFEYRVVDPHFVLSFVTGRSLNPITGSNWQGTGVIPDVQVPSHLALDKAMELARTELLRAR